MRRQRKIFRQQGKMPRPEQMNINVATWGRLLKKNIRLAGDQSDLGHDSRQGDQDGFAGEYILVYLGQCSPEDVVLVL